VDNFTSEKTRQSPLSAQNSSAAQTPRLGLRPLATFCGLKTITPRLYAALGTLDDETKFAETQLLALEQLVDNATCCVNQLLTDVCVNRHQAKKIERWTIIGFVTRHLSSLSSSSKNNSLRAMRPAPIASSAPRVGLSPDRRCGGVSNSQRLTEISPGVWRPDLWRGSNCVVQGLHQKSMEPCWQRHSAIRL